MKTIRKASIRGIDVYVSYNCSSRLIPSVGQGCEKSFAAIDHLRLGGFKVSNTVTKSRLSKDHVAPDASNHFPTFLFQPRSRNLDASRRGRSKERSFRKAREVRRTFKKKKEATLWAITLQVGVAFNFSTGARSLDSSVYPPLENRGGDQLFVTGSTRCFSLGHEVRRIRESFDYAGPRRDVG